MDCILTAMTIGWRPPPPSAAANTWPWLCRMFSSKSDSNRRMQLNRPYRHDCHREQLNEAEMYSPTLRRENGAGGGGGVNAKHQSIKIPFINACDSTHTKIKLKKWQYHRIYRFLSWRSNLNSGRKYEMEFFTEYVPNVLGVLYISIGGADF